MEMRYNLRCHGYSVPTIVTSSPDVVRTWINRIRARPLVVGLGLQWKYECGAATIEFCVGTNCLIFHMIYANRVPIALHRFLNDRRITFVALGYEDRRDLFNVMRDSVHNLFVPPLVNLHLVAHYLTGCSIEASLVQLASLILGWDGIVYDEFLTFSDWGEPLLGDEQVRYASLNVFISYMIGVAVEAWKYPIDFLPI